MFMSYCVAMTEVAKKDVGRNTQHNFQFHFCCLTLKLCLAVDGLLMQKTGNHWFTAGWIRIGEFSKSAQPLKHANRLLTREIVRKRVQQIRIDGDYIQNIIFLTLINISHLSKSNVGPSLCWFIRPLPPTREITSSTAMFSHFSLSVKVLLLMLKQATVDTMKQLLHYKWNTSLKSLPVNERNVLEIVKLNRKINTFI